MDPYRTLFPQAGEGLAQTERLAGRVITLPTGTATSERDVADICAVIRLVVEHGAEVAERMERMQP